MLNHVVRVLVLLAMAMTPVLANSAQSTPDQGTGDDSAFAPGIDVPAVYADERGNSIFQITVTTIELDWQEYDEYYTPDVGMMYIKVTLDVTNLTSRADTVDPFALTLVDRLGHKTEMQILFDSSELWLERVEVGAGETVIGQMVFPIYADVDPMMIVWQPDFSTMVFVYLGE